MKSLVFSLLLFVVAIYSDVKAQKLGSTRSATLILKDYSCGDNCYITFTDVITDEEYDFHNIDEKTDDAGIINEISNEYSEIETGESSGPLKSIGKKFTVVFEYKKIRKWIETQYGPKETKKWTKDWIMKSIRKLN